MRPPARPAARSALPRTRLRMRQLVRSQHAAQREALAADVTDVRLGVREHVRLQVAGRREALATLLADELLVGGVYQQVALVVGFRGELLATRAALEWLVQRLMTVHLVPSEMRRLIERLLTLITAVWLLPSVTQQMLLQVAAV